MHVVDEREVGGELQVGIDGALSESGSAVPATSGVVPGEVEYGGHRRARCDVLVVRD